MAKEDVLARVERDLGRGLVHPAMQRLASLVAAYPEDLEIRGRRAALNRQIGNVVEAGRWGFFSEDVTPEELEAFRKAYRRAPIRLSTLRIRHDRDRQLGPLAADRYRRLIDEAERDTGEPVAASTLAESGRWIDDIPCLIAALCGLVFVALAVIGLITVVRLFV